MRYFFATEHTSFRSIFQLVSIALVAETGQEYYAVSSEFDTEQVSSETRETVLPLLPEHGERKNLREIREEITAFIGCDEMAEFWGNSAHDFVVFAQLWDCQTKFSERFPYKCYYDLQQYLDFRYDFRYQVASVIKITDACVIAKAHLLRKIYSQFSCSNNSYFQEGDLVDVDSSFRTGMKLIKHRGLGRVGIMSPHLPEDQLPINFVGMDGKVEQLSVLLPCRNVRLLYRP